ncbi:glycerate kinase family protein [Dubosiella newyorkensis]|uniref:glycerate kinase family protein n=1 Tax=Dubosiella newyorkensis TaxID=1862672 RepID=UPI0023F20E5B|nr:glycerate kinase [Dubosiella newyorkensis]
MNVLIACDSFKGCMSSFEACASVKKGLERSSRTMNTQLFPMADGGEGFADILCHYIHGKMIEVDTLDLQGRRIRAAYAYNEEKKLAILDVASCIGLNLYPKDRRNPLASSSYGVGLMMQDALKRGSKKIVLGLGGSGTNDGGAGILKAFGARFYNKDRELLKDNAYSLEKIAFIDKRFVHIPKDVEFIVACDVKNHLLGENGCTYVFGKQKGIYPSQMKWLDQAMAHYAQKIDQTFHVDMNAFEGSGAAGGIGGVMLGVFHAKMVAGIDLTMQYAHFARALRSADLVITGEGQTDLQTMYGKVCYGIAREAKKHHVPTICLSGALGIGYEDLYNEGVIGIFSSADRAMDFNTALLHGQEKLEALAFSVGKLISGLEERKCGG